MALSISEQAIELVRSGDHVGDWTISFNGEPLAAGCAREHGIGSQHSNALLRGMPASGAGDWERNVVLDLGHLQASICDHTKLT